MKVLSTLLLAGAMCSLAGTAFPAMGEAPSCANTPAARQLDFWLGDWSVDSGRGRSTVHLSLDKCLLIESWASNTSDHRGENELVYNAEENAWYGLFADNHGRAHLFTGSAGPSEGELHGPGRDENGAAVLKRVRIVHVGPDTVDQIWEKSADKGATWSTEFKMEYLRKKP